MKLAKTPALSYDRRENILFVDFAGVRLETPADIDALFEFVRGFWKRECGGRKAYFVVGYDGFSINVDENAYYTEALKVMWDATTIATARYGGDSLQRSAAHVRGVKLGSGSNLYATRDQAIEAIRKLQRGESA